MAARAPITRQFYWTYAPDYYHWQIKRRMNKMFEFEAPLSPIKIIQVDPTLVSRFTGREDAGVNRWKSIGVIKSGSWDRRSPPDPDKPSYLQGISTANRLEETVLYKSIYNHFTKGVPWTETELIERAFKGISEDHIVLQSISKKEALQRCEYIDSLYENINNNGYKTQLELMNGGKNPSDRIGYLDLIADEITVDIGRDGELLFVDGRHRLIIAKVLGLETVPVVILVRHKEWMKKRDEAYTGTKFGFDHVDLNDMK